MKKPRFKKNDAKRQKKRAKHELERKEVRRQARLAHVELLRDIKNMPEEEAAKLLGQEDEELGEDVE